MRAAPARRKEARPGQSPNRRRRNRRRRASPPAPCARKGRSPRGDVADLLADVCQIENPLPVVLEEYALGPAADFVGGVGKRTVDLAEEDGNLNPQMAEHEVA